MRIVLADIKGTRGHVNKDTVAGGYGSRFRGTTKATKTFEIFRRLLINFPSIHTAYLAAIFTNAGHEVVLTRGAMVPGDLALVLSSIVDYRNEVKWAEQFRKESGAPVGFFGTLATHASEVLSQSADFLIQGEPEHAAMRLAAGEMLSGPVVSPAINDLDSLPFPRWEGVRKPLLRPSSYFVPVLSSRSCPEFCTYCPHRITASYRARSPENVIDEIEQLCRRFGKVAFIFRDPLFTEQRERSTAIAEEMIRRKLPVTFECETRLDDLDTDLIDLLHRAGLRSVTFGVESMDPQTLKKVGRRPISFEHQRKIVSYFRSKGIRTTGFYVFGFPSDTVESIRATIRYSIDLDSTMALFKILTPYPGTPLRKQMESQITEVDLEKFDGYTPTFTHPNLNHEQMSMLLGSAYSRFYVRPSWLFNLMGIQNRFSERLNGWDSFAHQKHDEQDLESGLAPLAELRSN